MAADTGKLILILQKGEGLGVGAHNGNTYFVNVTVGSNSIRTGYQSGSNNPEWNASGIFDASNATSVKFEVFDRAEMPKITNCKSCNAPRGASGSRCGTCGTAYDDPPPVDEAVGVAEYSLAAVAAAETPGGQEVAVTVPGNNGTLHVHLEYFSSARAATVVVSPVPAGTSEADLTAVIGAFSRMHLVKDSPTHEALVQVADFDAAKEVVNKTGSQLAGAPITVERAGTTIDKQIVKETPPPAAPAAAGAGAQPAGVAGAEAEKSGSQKITEGFKTVGSGIGNIAKSKDVKGVGGDQVKAGFTEVGSGLADVGRSGIGAMKGLFKK